MRTLALRAVARTYPVGLAAGAMGMFALGGFFPVIGAWLRDEIDSLAGVVETLGGVRVVTRAKDPDADLGPAIGRSDAPRLFEAVAEVARHVGAKPPQQIRLTYLPCCGVVAWGRSRALLLGMPLLHVLTLSELRAILAHELAHLARGDATKAADAARFVEGLTGALDRSKGIAVNPLRLWARLCQRVSTTLIAPVARGQEIRADRAAASLAGGETAAWALVKVAMVQPLFREVLAHYDPERPDAPNLYAFFRAFWDRLPEEVRTSMRLTLITQHPAESDPTHPPLPDRLALVQSYPEPSSREHDRLPAASTLGDLEVLEQMLHNRLFGLPAVEPSVFHRAGS